MNLSQIGSQLQLIDLASGMVEMGFVGMSQTLGGYFGLSKFGRRKRKVTNGSVGT